MGQSAAPWRVPLVLGMAGAAAVARGQCHWTPALGAPPSARFGATFASSGVFISPHAGTPGFLMVGGVTADGSLTDSVWAWTPTGAWWPQATGPSARYLACGADGVIFGGTVGPGTALGDTWVYRWPASNPWSNLSIPGPPARWGACMSQEANRSTAILFGGAAADGQPFGDTWRWDGTSWSLLPGAGPPARSLACVARTPQGLLLFGGYSASGVLGDTWLFLDGAWTEQPGAGPPARAEATMAAQYYGTAQRGAMLIGGRDGSGQILDDHWMWMAGSWTQMPSLDPRPSPRVLAHAATTSNITLLFGGTGEQGALGDDWYFTCGPPPQCYTNCDQSTAIPVLNVLDFNCFVNRFTAGDSYANCDWSTLPPVLNVLDFNCFINTWMAGCP
jgi:hypothetical protein